MSFMEGLRKQLQNDGLHKEMSENKYNKFISHIQDKIHAQIPEEHFDTTRVAAPTNVREEFFKGVNYKRAVIYLLSNGCHWALGSAHGCVMCGHLGKQVRRKEPIPDDDFLHQFNKEFDKNNFAETPLLNLYNNGSFFSDEEISPKARNEILKIIAANPHIKMVVLETRPEFVTEAKIREIKQILPDKHVEIAIGLELKDDFYRAMFINKGFSLKTYTHAAEIITRYLNLRTYVFLKPLVLTEKESIEQAIETIDYAFEVGSSTVSLEACTIQDFTLVKHCFERGLYNPPWLWSILDVVTACRTKATDVRKLIVGLFQFFPSPQTVPFNCNHCSQHVMEAIRHYNRTLDLSCFDGLTCQCKSAWEQEINEVPLPLEKRLETWMDHLKKE